MRSAPEGGYDFGDKRQWRRTIWRRFKDFCGNQVSDKHVGLLPSSEGDEVEVALANGFREYNVHAIDRNAAIVATLKRRRFPRINTYGVDVAAAAERMARNGTRLTCLNLDLCGFWAVPVAGAIMSVAQSGVLAERSVVSVTIMRGRERGWWAERLGDARNHIESNPSGYIADAMRKSPDAPRVAEIGAALYSGGIHRSLVPLYLTSGVYQSSVPMLWAMFAMMPKVRK